VIALVFLYIWCGDHLYNCSLENEAACRASSYFQTFCLAPVKEQTPTPPAEPVRDERYWRLRSLEAERRNREIHAEKMEFRERIITWQARSLTAEKRNRAIWSRLQWALTLLREAENG